MRLKTAKMDFSTQDGGGTALSIFAMMIFQMDSSQTRGGEILPQPCLMGFIFGKIPAVMYQPGI